MKHIWISGLKIEQIAERHEQFQNLKWSKEMKGSYSVHVFPNLADTHGLIALSDAFGGDVAWAKYEGRNPLIGKVYEDLDMDERDFLASKYPEFLKAVQNLD